MGLRQRIHERTINEILVTLGLLAVALAVHLLVPRSDSRRAFAKKHLGTNMASVNMAGGPIYRAGDRAVLFFDTKGAQGPLRGAVIVVDDKVDKVLLLYSREGINRTALKSKKLLDSFRGRSTQHTLVVDVVSGATVSSRLLIRAVNRQLKRWRKIRAKGKGRAAK